VLTLPVAQTPRKSGLQQSADAVRDRSDGRGSGEPEF